MGGDLHIVSPSLPSTPRNVPSGHGTKSSILYLHSPTVRPKDIVRLSGDHLIQDSLNMYAIKNNDNHETYHHDFNFHSHDSYFVEFAPTFNMYPDEDLESSGSVSKLAST